jgi:hypothetical protein
MKERLHRAVERAARNPVLRRSAHSLKPSPNLWGLLGIFLFFILPELLGFWRGEEIAAWAPARFLAEPDRSLRLNYWRREKIFEEGGSGINLGIGVGLALWLIYEWKFRRDG